MNDRLAALRARLRELIADGAAVAFSGGVDSALLLALGAEAARENGGRIHAFFFATSLHPAADRTVAQRTADALDVPFETLEIDEFSDPAVAANPPDRCYRCKLQLFTALRARADALRLSRLLDGTNADDLHAYRPGLRALRELAVCSPLAELGVVKSEVRDFARRFGLAVAERPSAPCLATRLPYGTRLDRELLRRIDAGERLLRDAGFPVVRLRVHGDAARIEVPPDAMARLFDRRLELADGLRRLGFAYPALDLIGFRSGSMDETRVK